MSPNDRRAVRGQTYAYASLPNPRTGLRVHAHRHDLRDIAARWHGGQASALYAYASTGSVADGGELADEVRYCFLLARQHGDDVGVAELEELWAGIQEVTSS